MNGLSLDLSKLSTQASEKQAIYLFNALSEHYKNIYLLDPTILSASSSILLDELVAALRSVGLNRTNRNTLARCVVAIIRRMERGPFETTTKIMAVLSKEKEEKVRWAAIVVLEHIFDVVGSQIVSLFGELISILSKTIKSSTTAPGMKAAALRTVAVALKHMNKLDEALHRDIMKFVKSCMSDKSYIIQVAAFQVSSLEDSVLYANIV